MRRNCWEEATAKKITALRNVELERLKKQERIVALVRFSFFTMPVLVAVVTFGSHALMGAEIDAGEVFSALALFTLIQNYLRMMPRAMATYNQVRAAPFCARPHVSLQALRQGLACCAGSCSSRSGGSRSTSSSPR